MVDELTQWEACDLTDLTKSQFVAEVKKLGIKLRESGSCSLIRVEDVLRLKRRVESRITREDVSGLPETVSGKVVRQLMGTSNLIVSILVSQGMIATAT